MNNGGTDSGSDTEPGLLITAAVCSVSGAILLVLVVIMIILLVMIKKSRG